MAKNVFAATILVFLIIADVSNAAFLSEIRRLVANSPKENLNVAPNPSPVVNGNQSTSAKGEEKDKEKQNEPKVDQTIPKTSPAPKDNKPDSKEENDTEKASKDSKEDVKEKDETKPDLPQGSKETCAKFEEKCHDAKSMIACVKNVDHASKLLVLLIQNEGDKSIKVDLTLPPSVNKELPEIAKLQTEEVNVSLPSGSTNVIRLNAGNGDCVLNLVTPISHRNFFPALPSYSKYMTPVYGTFSLLAVLLIVGGVWACCWFSKRKARTEIPYQELEMSMPETAAVSSETTQGWDQDWDDDWDEERAVSSPGAKNISANGLTSRSSSKNGWENWDD